MLSASSVSTSASNSGVPVAAMGVFAARPFASAKTASLVLMSPSTVSISKLVCTARESAACSVRALTRRSVQ